MTSDEFRQARRELGLSVNALADLINVDGRTIRRWEDSRNDRPPHPCAVVLVRLLQAGVDIRV